MAASEPVARLTSLGVTSDSDDAGFHPPLQARSRAALQRLLSAAEQVLVEHGDQEFTITAVAEQAGVSIGGVYRRFASKEQLLDAVRDRLLTNLEDAVATALSNAEPSLAGVVAAFTRALAGTFATSGKVVPSILGGPRTPDVARRALDALTALQTRFLDAATVHIREVSRPAPLAALTTALRTIIAAGVHRAAVTLLWPDDMTWQQWADETIGMILAYLTTDQKPLLPTK
jgi:AcrR family transcriptional regulator